MTNAPAGVDVSIVVIHWNVAWLLDGCLQSIAAECSASALTTETIVIDNGSDQRDVVDVLSKYSNVKAVELSTNIGYGAACNVGVARSSGKAVFLLNPDTVLLPGGLDALWDALNVAPHVGLTAPLLLNPDDSVQSMGYRFPGAMNVLLDLVPVPARLYESSINGRVPAGNGQLPLAIDYALGAALFMRKEAFEDVGGFDEQYFMYSEEVDLQQRLAERGWTRMLAPAARIVHFGGQSTSQSPVEMQSALWNSRAACFDRWTIGRQRALIRLAAHAGTHFDDLRRPEHRLRNRQIRETFDARLSQPQ